LRDAPRFFEPSTTSDAIWHIYQHDLSLFEHASSSKGADRDSGKQPDTDATNDLQNDVLR
jgi:hypothetical protein